MADSIYDFVMAQPLFDAHEHVMPVQQFAREEAHFLSIAGYAKADLVTAQGVASPGKEELPASDSPDFTRTFFGLWRKSRATGYCRATERACRDLLGVEYTEENADAIARSFRELMKGDPMKIYSEILRDRAGVQWGIKDSISAPEECADGRYPEFIRFNYRDDGLLCIQSRNDVHDREKKWKRSIYSLDDLIDGLNESISRCLASGKVTSFKIGVAYKRGLAFENPTKHEAETVFNRLMSVSVDATTEEGLASRMSRASDAELRPLQDYITHQYIRRATEEDLGIQVHTGYLAGNRKILSNINPMQLVPTFVLYPRTRFDLFHAGWPYHHEMGVIGKEFPNTWINMCWAWTMNPATMEECLDVWLDGVPHCKIFAFGSDTGHPINVYGYAVQAKEGIARVLQRKIDRGDFDLELAREIARAVMLDNGMEFHKL